MARPLITLEEHFCYSSELLNGDSNEGNPYAFLLKYMEGMRERLLDVGTLRLDAMDKGHISLQVVSHAPMAPTLKTDQCRAANNTLSTHIKANPERFAGFAVLPIGASSLCADELRRCVRDLGFVGALIDSHSDSGSYFDHPEYLPMFQAAQELDAPIYLHPTWPTDMMKDVLFTGNFDQPVSSLIGTSTFGWHSDVALHFVRLFASGLFDKLPRLKIILGHMGEMLPFMLQRISLTSSFWGLKRDFKTVWAENVWITTSGNWSVDPMACILRNTPVSHIMLSVDYPFIANDSAERFLLELEEAGLVSAEDLDAIAYRNAEQLLGITALKVFTQ